MLPPPFTAHVIGCWIADFWLGMEGIDLLGAKGEAARHRAALDAAGADHVALVGISAAAMTVLRLAAEQTCLFAAFNVLSGRRRARLYGVTSGTRGK